MTSLVSAILTVIAAALAVPVAVFVIEVIAALILPRRSDRLHKDINSDRRPRVAVLIPAHDESAGLLPTLADLKVQLGSGDRLLVVADNCTDDTAATAVAGGAEVIERHDPKRRGKGYALDFGLAHLSSDAPDVVIIVDADCRIAHDTIAQLVATCAATGRPAQALYLMAARPDASINQQVAQFAWRVKNWLRPLGLQALHLPCQLMGTGMAFPWVVIRSVDLASGWLVEDLKLGLDLAANGHPPVFCPSACVTSKFSSSVRATRTQRERWERGHLGMILRTAPRLLCQAVVRRDFNLLALALDLAVLPLSLLTLFVVGMFAIASFYALLGFSSPALAVSTATMLAFIFAAGLAWAKCGRDVVPLNAIFSIAPYILRKLGLYRGILFNRTAAEWIRTDRANSE